MLSGALLVNIGALQPSSRGVPGNKNKGGRNEEAGSAGTAQPHFFHLLRLLGSLDIVGF